MNGSDVRVVMSQAAADPYIHVPMFATSVAVQMTAYVRWRNGAHGEPECADVFASLALIAGSKMAVSMADGTRCRTSD
jgi:hypothetical protein